MALARSESIINLPWEVIQECNGLAFDIGGSVMKCVYIHKDDWAAEQSTRKQDVCPVRLINVVKEEIHDSLDYLKERLYIKRASAADTPVVYVTGTGALQFIDKLTKEFQVKTEIFAEMDMFMECHRYLLDHLCRNDVVHEHDKEAMQQAESYCQDMLQTLAKMKAQTTMDMKSPAENQLNMGILKSLTDVDLNSKFSSDDVFPCMVVMCGSAGGCLLLNKDGSFQPIEMLIRRVGKMFYGLGSLLTGAKSYAELMEMAAKGTDKTVHEYVSDMREGVEEKRDESFYSSGADSGDFPVYLWGKAVTKTTHRSWGCVLRIGFGRPVNIPRSEDFKPEDLARALAFTMATDLVEIVHLQLYRLPKPVKHVFFGGNHVTHQLMRHLITLEWFKRDLSRKLFSAPKSDMIDVHFLRHGAHYGALGGLLSHRLRKAPTVG